MVLATALPKDSVSYALASSSAFAANMASSLAAGNTPAWYQALPSDVKSLLPALYPVAASPTPTPTPSSSASSSEAVSTSVYAVGTISASPSSKNSTSASSIHMPTLSASATRSGIAQATANAASYPGAALGASLGFLGMLAL
jgi:hypothetical protein